MALLLFYLFLALFVSFTCSIMEAVLLSTPRPFLIAKQDSANKWPLILLDFKINIDKPLSAILSLNTVAHTVGAAGVGAQAVKVFGEASFGIASAILTILILVITEIIPKTLGARYWRKLAKSSAFLIRITIIITYPLVVISSAVTALFSRSKHERTTSREEIAALASIGTDEGVFTENEDRILQNLLKLRNVKAKEIMTPRVVTVMADETLTLTEFLENKNYLKFSRIPVYYENDENVTGYVIRQKVLEYLAEDKHTLKLKDVKRDIIVAPSLMPLFTILEKLLESKEHITLLVDEYGGVDGIVTLEDIIETFLGLEIVDEKDTITDMQEYARQRWKTKQAKTKQSKKKDSPADQQT